jgi:hypothetical protein
MMKKMLIVSLIYVIIFVPIPYDFVKAILKKVVMPSGVKPFP